MPHFPRPFFRPSRGLWYVQLDGKQVNLGSDQETAFSTYHGLMQRRPKIVVTQHAVCVVVEQFLDWCKKHRNAHTFRWYQDRLSSFCKSIPISLTVDQLKPHHVQKWVDDYPVEITDGSRRNLIASIKRAMKWGEEQGYFDRSPIAHMKKPGAGRKEQIVTPDEYRSLLEGADQPFHDLLTVTWETGCRPQESLRVEACHVDLPGNRWLFPSSKSKGKKTPRVVYLTTKAIEITKRLIERHREGKLFRNEDGRAWTSDAVNCRFYRIQKATGKKFSLYALRHTWINRKLLSGVDAFTVAVLAGHSDPSMLAKHYAHLSQAPGYLLQQANR